jgi:hypothetical protein
MTAIKFSITEEERAEGRRLLQESVTYGPIGTQLDRSKFVLYKQWLDPYLVDDEQVCETMEKCLTVGDVMRALKLHDAFFAKYAPLWDLAEATGKGLWLVTKVAAVVGGAIYLWRAIL